MSSIDLLQFITNKRADFRNPKNCLKKRRTDETVVFSPALGTTARANDPRLHLAEPFFFFLVLLLLTLLYKTADYFVTQRHTCVLGVIVSCCCISEVCSSALISSAHATHLYSSSSIQGGSG
jgi:hypothetical protein